MTTEGELREALWALSAHAPATVRRETVMLLNGAITELVAARDEVGVLRDVVDEWLVRWSPQVKTHNLEEAKELWAAQRRALDVLGVGD